MPPDTGGGTRLWHVIRAVSAAVTLLAVATLGTIAVTVTGTGGRHTTVIKHTTVVQRVAAAHPATSAATVPTPSVALSPAPLSAVAAPAPASAPLAEATAFTTPTPTPTTTPDPAATSPAPTTTPAPGGVTSSPTPSELPACPLPLSAPANPGGLQSLVGFAPFFGPFSSEAFAAAPLFQPFLQDIGPFLVALANAYGTESPSLAPLVAQFESFENEGFTVILPVYGPHRSQFQADESALATALAPLAKDVANNAAASCVVDVEAVLTQAAS
jgi:hypothetical protein